MDTSTAKIKAIKKQIFINALNSENWSHAKRFTMAAIERGIDLNDTFALNIFGLEYNENLQKKQKKSNKGDDNGLILDYVYSKF